MPSAMQGQVLRDKCLGHRSASHSQKTELQGVATDQDGSDVQLWEVR